MLSPARGCHAAILPERAACCPNTRSDSTTLASVDGSVRRATFMRRFVREALISGNFSEAEARKLAAVIGGGILPFSLSVIEVR